jgi:preprotein translocase subunit SecD
MFEPPRWKIWGIFLTIALGIAFAIPSFFPRAQVEAWPTLAPRTQIALGLDLAGGSQLLLEADLADFSRQRLATMEDSVSQELRRDARIQVGDISTANGRISFLLRDPSQLDAAVERLRTLTQGVGLTGTRTWDVTTQDGNRVVMTPTVEGETQALKDAMTVARDVVRRRIDPSGTREVTVINQGSNRILVQVPGIDDPEGLKRLLGQTARLEFKLLAESNDPALAAQGRAPPGAQMLPMADGSEAIAVQRRAMVSGENIISAQQGFDEQTGEPVVNIRLDSTGARRFARVTTENVGKPFAIILDNKVLSAPRINDAILGGASKISGGFTVESANELAVSLSAGNLPVDFDVIEERSVGPDLGRDSIRAGTIASIIAILAVMTFMIVTYGRFGVYANIALILNALLILGIMGIFGSALTLPGIAGFVLTIGAAVDANVLINERIREEQRRGRKMLDAIDTGYKEASTAIFDANITNVIAAALMWYFGSGPVRGFAIVLLIGIITSVFTAVNFTRLMVALWVKRKRPRELHI